MIMNDNYYFIEISIKLFLKICLYQVLVYAYRPITLDNIENNISHNKLNNKLR
jgi:hypothetical protein